MKVGDKVQVCAKSLAHWPSNLPTRGVVLELDEGGSLGVLVEFPGITEGAWVAASHLEPDTSLAMRDNGGKPELCYALTFPEALKAIADVSTYGATKYERGNYLKGAPLSQSVNSLLRHLLLWWSGEDKDPESGHGHLAHVAWNALRLCQESIVRKDLDDRIAYETNRPTP